MNVLKNNDGAKKGMEGYKRTYNQDMEDPIMIRQH